MRQICRLLLVWAGAVAGYEYCSRFTARYLTYLQREDVLIFHHGQGYIARPADGCQAKHKDRHAVSFIKPFRPSTWLNDTLYSARSAGLPSATLNNYAIAETPSGFIAVGGGVMGAKIHFGKDSYIMLMHKPTWSARWSKPHPIIGTEHPGCVDVRLSRCEYDGKLSVAAVNASPDSSVRSMAWRLPRFPHRSLSRLRASKYEHARRPPRRHRALCEPRGRRSRAAPRVRALFVDSY